MINYTGDRINFGLAVEKAKHEGLKVGQEDGGFDRIQQHALIALIQTASTSVKILKKCLFTDYALCVCVPCFSLVVENQIHLCPQ